MFYENLREPSFRAHHTKQIHSYTRAVVRSVKRLWARIDRYDYRLNLESKTLVIKLRSGYEVKLPIPDDRIGKFVG